MTHASLYCQHRLANGRETRYAVVIQRVSGCTVAKPCGHFADQGNIAPLTGHLTDTAQQQLLSRLSHARVTPFHGRQQLPNHLVRRHRRQTPLFGFGLGSRAAQTVV